MSSIIHWKVFNRFSLYAGCAVCLSMTGTVWRVLSIFVLRSMVSSRGIQLRFEMSKLLEMFYHSSIPTSRRVFLFLSLGKHYVKPISKSNIWNHLHLAVQPDELSAFVCMLDVWCCKCASRMVLDVRLCVFCFALINHLPYPYLVTSTRSNFSPSITFITKHISQVIIIHWDQTSHLLSFFPWL